MPIVFPIGHWYGNISRPMRNMRGLCVEIPSGGAAATFYGIVFWAWDATNAKLEYWEVDEDAGTKVVLDSFQRTPPESSLNSVITDGTFVWVPQNVGDFPGGQTLQIAWDGSAFLPFFTAPSSASFTSDVEGLIKLAGHDGYFITVGQGDGDDRGMTIVDYATTPPLSYSSTDYGATLDFWIGAMDFRYGNPGAADFGDAVVFMPVDTYRMTSYTISGTVATQVSQIAVSDTHGRTHAYGWNRDDGVIGTLENAAAQVSFYQASMADFTLSAIGVGTTTNIALAVGFADNGVVVTVEDTGGAQDIIRTYTRVGAVLTEQDSYSLASTTNNDAYIRTNPYTGRVYVLTGTDANGLLILDIAANGTITVLAEFVGYSTPNAFGGGITFLPTPLATTVMPAGYIVDFAGIPVIDDQGNFIVEG